MDRVVFHFYVNVQFYNKLNNDADNNIIIKIKLVTQKLQLPPKFHRNNEFA